ncbi:B9 domain-containing protein 2-like protein, partial [Leptotrombidium deliense]
MAEVYIFGQILGGNEFNENGLFCKWSFVFGNNWTQIEGTSSGQTQVDYSTFEDRVYWCHPIDIHFLTLGVQNWPKIVFEVWKQDLYGKCTLCSYGFSNIPVEPGFHEFRCFTWKPLGKKEDQIAALFTGAGLRLTHTSTISENFERFRLQTEPSGEITIQLFVIFKNFDTFGIDTK